MSKTLFIACLLLISVGAPASAAFDDLARYELALGGYQIGMTYEDAVMVRPFVSLENFRRQHSGIEVTQGFVDQVYIDDVAFRFRVEFVENRIERILGRFPRLDAERVGAALVEVLGEGENRDRSVPRQTGVEDRQMHRQWVFPEARLDLVATSGTVEYATLALQLQNAGTRQRHAEYLERLRGASTAQPAQPQGAE